MTFEPPLEKFFCTTFDPVNLSSQRTTCMVFQLRRFSSPETGKRRAGSYHWTVRIWNRETGKPYTSIESTAEFNDMALYPRSGLVFLANQQPRMQVFYIPSLGPAP